MKHCCAFNPMDVWFLSDTDKYNQRKLSFGICPVCSIPIAVLIQFDCINESFMAIKKLGISAEKFVKSLKSQKYSSISQINQQKFKPVTYKWVYGVNKESKSKITQYAKDFFGNIVKQRDVMK